MPYQGQCLERSFCFLAGSPFRYSQDTVRVKSFELVKIPSCIDRECKEEYKAKLHYCFEDEPSTEPFIFD